MSCYGKYSANCFPACPFFESCRYYSTTPEDIRPLSCDCSSLDNVSPDLVGAAEPEESLYEYVNIDDVKKVFKYLSELDDYTLYILKYLIVEHETLIGLATRRNTSKQSLHRKILRLVWRRPWLAPVLQLLFTRKNQIQRIKK